MHVQARLAQPLPHFFALQLAWQRPCESADDIRDTLAAVQEVPHPPLSLPTHLHHCCNAGCLLQYPHGSACHLCHILLRRTALKPLLPLQDMALIGAVHRPEVGDRSVIGAVHRPAGASPDTEWPLNRAQELDLAELYLGLLPGAAVYDLQSAVCYYGHHYSAFVCHPHTGMWLAIADSEVRTIGSWADARGKCVAGAIQPSVLLFKARFLASS